MPIGLMMSIMMERPPRALLALKFSLYKLGFLSPFPTSLAKGYDAPFPDASFRWDQGRCQATSQLYLRRCHWKSSERLGNFLRTSRSPLSVPLSDNDPVTAGGRGQFLDKVPGTRGLDHPTIPGGGHFVQESAPEEDILRHIVTDKNKLGLLQQAPVKALPNMTS